MKERKPKTSYSCAPCKRLKSKCDHAIPCSNCVKGHREEECLKSPAKTLSQFKELIRPNASFGRISKDTKIQTKKLSASSISSIESITFSSAQTSPVQSSPVNIINSLAGPIAGTSSQQVSPITAPQNLLDSDIVGFLERRLTDSKAALDEVMHKNSILAQHNEELIKQLGASFQMSQSRASVLDLYNYQTVEQITNFKRAMVDQLPPKEILIILKEYFMANIHYGLHVLNTVEFNLSFDTFCVKLFNEHNWLEVDLYWLSLLFVILATSLSLLTRDFVNLNPFILTRMNINGKAQLWFNSSRQIITFIRTENSTNLIPLETFFISVKFMQLNSKWKLQDQMLAQAVNDALQMKLDKLRLEDCSNMVEFEMKKRVWFELANLDTQRALSQQRTPFILSFVGKTSMVSNLNHQELYNGVSRKLEQFTDISAVIVKSEINRIMNEYEVRSKMSSVDELFRLTLSIDEKLCLYYETVNFEHSDTLPRVVYLQLMSIESFFVFNRFKLYQPLLGLSLPLVEKLCLKLASSTFKPYQQLKSMSLNILQQDPLLHTQLHTLVQSCIIQCIYLTLNHDVTITIETETKIQQEIDEFLQDLTTLETAKVMLQQVPYVVDSLRVLSNLRNHIRPPLASFSDLRSSNKMSVDSLIVNNSFQSAVWAPTTTYDRPSKEHQDQALRQYCELLSSNPNAIMKNEEIFNEIKTKTNLTDTDFVEFKINSYI